MGLLEHWEGHIGKVLVGTEAIKCPLALYLSEADHSPAGVALPTTLGCPD